MKKTKLLIFNKQRIRSGKISMCLLLLLLFSLIMMDIRGNPPDKKDLSDPVSFRTVIGPGGSPSIAADDGGKIHFCYLSEGKEGKLLYATFKDGIITRDTIDNGNYNYWPVITMDKTGKVHIAYGKGTSGNRQILYRSKTGEQWSNPETINPAWDPCNICIKSDKNDSIHISYMDSPMGGNLWYAKRSVTWSKEVVKYGLHNSSSFDLDTNNHAHFAYYLPFFKKAGYGKTGLNYLTNSPNGTWQEYEYPDADWKGVQLQTPVTDISVDIQNRPHISYVGQEANSGTEDYKYVVKTATVWSDSIIETGTSSGGPSAIDTDPSGQPHIIYIRTDSYHLKYATYFEGVRIKHDLDENVHYAGDQKLIDICIVNDGFAHIAYVKNGEIRYITIPVHSPAPKISLSPSGLSFGTVDTGAISTLPLYIKNEGELDLHISGIKLTGADYTEFSVLNSCDVIVPKDSCEVELTFAPKVIGNKQATLEIDSDDPDMPVIKADITGRTPYPVIQPVPEEITFSVVEVGEHEVKMLTLKNTGDANLEIDSLKIIGEGAEAYSWISICQDIPPFTDCNLDVYFTPPTSGTHYAELHIYSNDPENPEVTVSLEGRPPSGRLEIQNGEDNILDFGTVPVGEIAAEQLILKNTGERDLVISSRNISGTDASLFHASNACTLIPPGESCGIDMIFQPVSVGISSASFIIESNDPDLNSFILTLQGTGIESESWSYLWYSDETAESEVLYCMDTLSSGAYIVGGKTGKKAYLAEVHSDGSIKWQKNFSEGTGSSIIHVVRETWNKGLVAAGLSNNHHSWISRLDKDGGIIWQKKTENDYWGKIRDLQVTSDSGFIAVGETWPRGPGDPDLWIGKFDSTGTIIWQKLLGTYGGSGGEYYQRGFAVLETYEGNFIVAGSSTVDHLPYHSLRKHPDGGYLYGGEPSMMFKFSPDGTLLWQRRISGYPKFWLAHINSGDEILWQYQYPNSGNPEWIFDLTLASNGDIVAMGTENKVSNNDMRVMRLTKTGDIVWQKIYRAPGDQEGYMVQAHSSGSIAIAGYYEMKAGDPDGWLLLMSPEGQLEGCTSDYLENSTATATSTSYVFENMSLPVVIYSHNFIDAALAPVEGKLISQDYCSGFPSDADYDGIPNEEEYSPSGQDNTYDGNNDGLPDALQNNVASFRTFNGSGYVTMEAPSGTQLKDVSAEANPSPGDQPEDITFPLGFFKFSVTGLEVGGSVAINLHFPAELTPVTYYKYAKTSGNPEPHWYEYLHDGQTGAVIEAGKIILHFKDGARGDEDITENGIIEDIGGPGTQKTTGIEDQSDPSSPSISAIIYPNPSRGNTNIGFKLSQTEHVKIEVYDFLGRKVRTLISEELAPGYHKVEFRPGSLPGGVYLIDIEAGKYKDIQKLMLLK